MGVYITYTPRLPSEYQEVEYIEASGTQYIESGYIPNGNTKIASKFACTNTTTNNCPLFGAATSSRQNEYVLWTTTTSITAEDGHALFSAPAAWDGTAYVKELPKITPGDVIEFRYDKTGGKYGSTTWTRNLSGGSAGQNMLIFGLRRNGIESSKFKGKLFYFRIWDNGTLVRDLVPCYRKQDGVIGLYDLVNSVFYTNSGTGTFSKGNDVTMVEMKNAYIGEVWTPNANTLLYRPLTSNANDESGNSNNGTGYNVTSYSSDGAYFVGNNQQARIEFPHSLNPGTSFTINFWFKKTDTRTASYLFANRGNSYKRMLLGAENGNIQLQMGNGSSSEDSWSNITTYNTSEWTNITIVRNGASVTIYKNGILAGTHTFSYNPSRGSSINGFSIMRCSWNSAGTNGPIGYFKDYIIETKLRTAQEVSNYYNTFKSNYGL